MPEMQRNGPWVEGQNWWQPRRHRRPRSGTYVLIALTFVMAGLAVLAGVAVVLAIALVG